MIGAVRPEIHRHFQVVHVDEPTSDGVLDMTDAFADGENLAWGGPAVEVEGKRAQAGFSSMAAQVAGPAALRLTVWRASW
ncbi:MAG: hypothetical protein ABI600_05645 [Luteolibacter sp.]